MNTLPPLYISIVSPCNARGLDTLPMALIESKTCCIDIALEQTGAMANTAAVSAAIQRVGFIRRAPQAARQ